MNFFYYITSILLINTFVKSKFKIHVTNKEGTFYMAREYCSSLGKHIVRVESELENQLLFKTPKASVSHWIDYNDIKEEGKWENSDKVPMKFQKWANNSQPDNWNIDENCVEIGDKYINYWNDVSCRAFRGIICQDYEDITVSFNSLIANKKGTFNVAKAYCNSFEKHILRIESSLENEKIATEDVPKFWIDYNDHKEKGKWVNSDNVPMTFNNWNDNEPSNYNNESCAEMGGIYNKKWNDVDCYISNGIICQDYKDDFQNFIITPENGSFIAAKRYCNSLGKHILRIESFQEYFEMNRKLYFAGKIFWIDYTYNKNKSIWENSENDPFEFDFLISNKSVNNTNMDCLEIGYEDFQFKKKNCLTTSGVICQNYANPQRKIVVVTAYTATYRFALVECKKIGLRLPQINNEEENKYMYKLVKAKKVFKYWIDANDKKDMNVWVNSEEKRLKYFNWGPDQPSVRLNNSLEENCIEVDVSNKGLWNVNVCTATANKVICVSENEA